MPKFEKSTALFSCITVIAIEFKPRAGLDRPRTKRRGRLAPGNEIKR